MASWFITSTCQVIPKSFTTISDNMHDLMMSVVDDPKDYSILCGSFAEFYIRPLNTCISDTDFIMCKASELAFSDHFPVLPADMSGLAETIRCFEIIPYHTCPGFVRLRLSGVMDYNWKYKKYEFYKTADPDLHVILDMTEITSVYQYSIYRSRMSSSSNLPNITCGPAVRPKSQTNSSPLFSTDAVRSAFCPAWPREAQNWPIRPRKYGWPTFDVISEVVQNGCHVVYVQHRRCRDDKRQWRLSFSIAEVILLQSWTKTQQIVYHMLRFFAKRELIQKDCSKEDEILCTYHLKTLMLWTCEEMKPEWWNSSTVIAICCELLQKLAECLNRRYCPNYFIPEANLLHQLSSFTISDKTTNRINEFQNSGVLGNWFVETYILPFIAQTHFIFQNNGEVVSDFVDYVLPLIEFRKAAELDSLDRVFFYTFSNSNQDCRSGITGGSFCGLRKLLKHRQYGTNLNPNVLGTLTLLPTIEKVLCLKYYSLLLFSLHVAYGLCLGEISWDSNLIIEFVQGLSMQNNILKSKYHNFPNTYFKKSSRFHFLRAHNLMQNLTGLNSHPEFQLLCLMSKDFLRRSLECNDSQISGIAPAALTYLAALHFATSEYQQAIRCCSEVLSARITTLQINKETLNAGCLRFIDDIARIVGMCLLHKKIIEDNLHYINRRLYLDLRLSPDVFAHHIAVLSAEKMSTTFDIYPYLSDSAFPVDEYVRAVRKPKFITTLKSGNDFNTARQIVYRRRGPSAETDAAYYMNPLIDNEILSDALMEYGLENMSSFYSVLNKDYGVQCNTVDCYRALYLYKCRRYDEVLHLCERILSESDLQRDLRKRSFANVMVIPPLDSFFDGDVQSLLGFHTLFYYLSPCNGDTGKVEITIDLEFEDCFAQVVYYDKLGLFSFVTCHYYIKRHYFLGRHFLARYLKVRCCVDCNLHYADALTEFVAMKTHNPFELIIRKFLLHKLHIIKK